MRLLLAFILTAGSALAQPAAYRLCVNADPVAAVTCTWTVDGSLEVEAVFCRGTVPWQGALMALAGAVTMFYWSLHIMERRDF